MSRLTLNSNILDFLRVFATAVVFFCHSMIVGKECYGLDIYHGGLRFMYTPAWGGVWMFLAIGGFLAAYGFDQNKYTLDKAGVVKYYRGRIAKVLIPTWVFLSLMYIFNMQESHVEWTTLLQWLTCTYNGSGAGIVRVGASWYIFIIMWLYLLTPILLKLLYKFEESHRGKELQSYLRLLVVLCLFGIIFRLGGVFLNVTYDRTIYYNWFYANVTGVIDIFAIGMIGERLMHYLPEITEERVRKYRTFAFISLATTTLIYTGGLKYLRNIYMFLGPCMFSVSSIALVVAYSYKRDEVATRTSNMTIFKLCSIIAPYTFMFYLWHSPLLGYVAEKLEVMDVNLHYFSMLIIGGIVTVYIAYLMTKMNDSIIKTIK